MEQDPYDKSAEWLAVSPRGLVPCLVHNGNSIYESQVCIEYLDEAFPEGCSLLPESPVDRATVRIWCDYICKKLVPPFYAILMKRTESEREQAKSAFTEAIKELMSAMKDSGPYFLGSKYSMVDIMMFPHCLRINQILEHYRKFNIPATPEFERYHKWYQAMLKRQAIKDTIQNNARIQAKYKRYEDDTADTLVADAIRLGIPMP